MVSVRASQYDVQIVRSVIDLVVLRPRRSVLPELIGSVLRFLEISVPKF
jgi:hypothetical protein